VLVSYVMVTDLVTVGPDANLQKVVDQMNHAHIRHLYMRLVFQKDVSRRPLQFGSTVYNVALSHSQRKLRRISNPTIVIGMTPDLSKLSVSHIRTRSPSLFWPAITDGMVTVGSRPCLELMAGA
jgi:hypothetical protein